jgi:hypothetical protein
VDLRVFIQVVRRHKVAAILGVAAAVFLALFSYVRIDPTGSPTFTYRKSVLFASREVLQITQPGFYEGRVTVDSGQRDSLLELAPLYARLANSDPVRKRMLRSGPIPGGVDVNPVIDDTGNGLPLPLVEIIAFTRSAQLAPKRAARQARAFIGYLQANQAANGIPERRRVSVSVIKGPSKPFIAVPRKKTLPVIVFMSMLIATCALVLVLDNVASRRGARAGEDRSPLRAGGRQPQPQAEPQPEPVIADAPVEAQPRALRRERRRRGDLKPAPGRSTVVLRPTLGSDEQSQSAEADG